MVFTWALSSASRWTSAGRSSSARWKASARREGTRSGSSSAARAARCPRSKRTAGRRTAGPAGDPATRRSGLAPTKQSMRVTRGKANFTTYLPMPLTVARCGGTQKRMLVGYQGMARQDKVRAAHLVRVAGVVDEDEHADEDPVAADHARELQHQGQRPGGPIAASRSRPEEGHRGGQGAGEGPAVRRSRHRHKAVSCAITGQVASEAEAEAAWSLTRRRAAAGWPPRTAPCLT